MIELLLSLILALTGIERTIDPAMTAEAQRRVEMIQTDFSHDGLTTWEVLAWNTWPDAETATRRTAEQWRGSPSHWAILTDRSLTRIGCAMTQAAAPDNNGTAWYFVCALAQGSAPASSVPPAPPAPAPTAVPEPPSSEPRVMLPDTAMRPSG